MWQHFRKGPDGSPSGRKLEIGFQHTPLLRMYCSASLLEFIKVRMHPYETLLYYVCDSMNKADFHCKNQQETLADINPHVITCLESQA